MCTVVGTASLLAAQAEMVEDWGTGCRLPDAAALLRGSAADGGQALAVQLAPLLARLQRPEAARCCRALATELNAQPDGVAIAAEAVLEELRQPVPTATGFDTALQTLLDRRRRGASRLSPAADTGPMFTPQGAEGELLLVTSAT